MKKHYPEILLISNRLDFSSDYLITKILERELTYIRINSEDVSNWRIKYTSGSPNKFCPRFDFEDQTFDLSKLKGVYFRKAPTVYDVFESSDFQEFLTREAREFFEGIYIGLEANWVNDMFGTYRAERKLFQLKKAHSLGFTLPQTLVTNDPVAINRFVSTGNRIIKPISNGFVRSSTGMSAIFTNAISSDTCISTEGITELPVYLQQRIDADCDVRVTVIGENVFPVAIHKVDSIQVDWRRPNIKKVYSSMELPKRIARMCVQLTQTLGLKYAAIDLMQRANEYVFLEINPAGEWVWLEVELGIPISRHIINELINIRR